MMDPRDLKRVLEALVQADVSEFSLQTAEYTLSIKRGAVLAVPALAPIAMPAPAPAALPPAADAAAASAPVPATAAPAEARGHQVRAPIVGTFYRAPSPDAPNYVEVGDRVEVGKVLCIIEAMKLMNEIEAEVAGTVRQVLVGNAEPVEYGQPLFAIEP